MVGGVATHVVGAVREPPNEGASRCAPTWIPAYAGMTVLGAPPGGAKPPLHQNYPLPGPAHLFTAKSSKINEDGSNRRSRWMAPAWNWPATH